MFRKALMDKKECIYYENGECLLTPIENPMTCNGICKRYTPKLSWGKSIGFMLLFSVLIYMTIFISFSIGKSVGREEGATRASCMKYMVESDKCLKWTKK